MAENNKKSGFQSKSASILSGNVDLMELPQCLEAEQGIIGLILYKNLIYDTVSDILRAEHFFAPLHQKIWQKITDTIENSDKISIVSLSGLLADDPDFINVGGAQYIVDLVDSIISETNARHYCDLIHEAYKKRQFFLLGSEIKALAPREKSSNLAARIDGFMTDILSEEKAEMFSLGASTKQALQNMEKLKSGEELPILTGIEKLDHKITGFYGGRLIIIAGRPAMGKTALALSIAKNQSNPFEIGGLIPKTPLPVLFFSLEMPKEELSMRILARETGISVEKQQSHAELSKQEWDVLIRAHADLIKHKLFIIDKNCNTLQSIKAFSRRFVRSQGKGVIFIDYLGLIEGDRAAGNKVQQIEEITVGLKRLAKEIDCPIVLLCQLSRALESRDDKRPQLSDLRDSGSIEQDADMVMFCYRDEYYLNMAKVQKWPKEKHESFEQRQREHEYNLEQSRGKADIIIGKYRSGTTGSVRVNFSGLRQEFS